MAGRLIATSKYAVGTRTALVTYTDRIGVDDCFEVQCRAVMHRYITEEDAFPVVPRDVKAWMLRRNQEI
jgi:hypothetical protein